MSPKIYRAYAQSALVLAYAFGTVAPTLAQDAAPPTTAKWRPKNGIYALSGKDFAKRCETSSDFSVDLVEKRITGDEWSCEVKKLTDTGPNAVRFDLSCSDENLEAAIPNPNPDSDEMKFAETMTFRKIDEKSVFIRKSQNGKINFPESKVGYCPPKAQRAYLEDKAKSKADAEQKDAAQKAAWQPRDGVYASPGADFDDRCMKSGDAVVRLAQSAVSIDGTSCYVAHVSVEPPNSVSLNVNCGGSLVIGNGSKVEGAPVEAITLSNADDQSVIFRRSRNGQALGSDRQLRYCPEAAQRNFTESKAK